MADVKISALPASTVALAGTEVLPIVQSSVTKQVSVANLTAGRAVAALNLSTSGSTSTTPVLSFNATNCNIASGATVANTYLQAVMQNKSSTAGASTNWAVSNDLGTDSTYYGEMGMNSSVFSASTPADYFSINNGIYFSGHDGDISYGSGNGFKTYLAWGTTGQSAHVINATGALGLSTNLGTTPALSGTTGYGTAKNVLVSQGSAAAPVWSTSTDILVNGITIGISAGSVASNTVFGASAFGSNVTGASNVAIGQQALRVNTASNNTSVGFQSGYSTSNGNNNVFVGNQAGFAGTAQTFVTYVGGSSGVYQTGNGNTAVGYTSMQGVNGSSTGSYNAAFGMQALIGTTSGSNNNAFGYNALGANTTGSSNVAMGYQALNDATASNNTAVGYQAGLGLTTGASNTYIGYATTQSGVAVTGEIVVGSSITGKGSNTAFIGGSSGAYNGANAATWSVTSDARIKKNIVDVTSGLGIVLALRPVEFDYISNDKHDIGFIAQEYQTVLPAQVAEGSDGMLSLSQNLVPYLVKALQELNAKFDAYVASHP